MEKKTGTKCNTRNRIRISENKSQRFALTPYYAQHFQIVLLSELGISLPFSHCIVITPNIWTILPWPNFFIFLVIYSEWNDKNLFLKIHWGKQMIIQFSIVWKYAHRRNQPLPTAGWCRLPNSNTSSTPLKKNNFNHIMFGKSNLLEHIEIEVN